jgi:mRNA interferase MazF
MSVIDGELRIRAVEPSTGAALAALSESALSDWNRPEEDEAWAHLQLGEVILVPFPFSNLEAAKKRPALVAATAEFGDVILCQITSQPFSSTTAVAIRPTDLPGDGLNRDSYAAPTSCSPPTRALRSGASDASIPRW